MSGNMTGYVDNMRDAAINREKIRSIGSRFVLQEMNFKD